MKIMSKTNTIDRGIIMFAHNNTEIDYFRLAVVNATLIQRYLGLEKQNIAVVTDLHSLEHAQKQLGKRFIKNAIGHIIINEKDVNFKHSNVRTYKDTSLHSKHLSFYNKNRSDAYDLSPFQETILIDADYLVLSDSLNQCWAHNNELMMNWEYKDVYSSRKYPSLTRLHNLGISMYWATVVYFRKTDYCETFFNLVKQVRDNKDYYGQLFRINNKLYRNDFSFSVAAHILGGFQDKTLPQLPFQLFKTFDTDDVYEVNSDLSLVLCLEKPDSPGDFIATKWKGVDVHIMNKWALSRISNGLLEYV